MVVVVVVLDCDAFQPVSVVVVQQQIVVVLVVVAVQ